MAAPSAVSNPLQLLAALCLHACIGLQCFSFHSSCVCICRVFCLVYMLSDGCLELKMTNLSECVLVRI